MMAGFTGIFSSITNHNEFNNAVRTIGAAYTVIGAIILAVVNALGYYFWDIVKSAYKQIKDENEQPQPTGYMMTNYEKAPPAYHHHQQV